MALSLHRVGKLLATVVALLMATVTFQVIEFSILMWSELSVLLEQQLATLVTIVISKRYQTLGNSSHGNVYLYLGAVEVYLRIIEVTFERFL